MDIVTRITEPFSRVGVVRPFVLGVTLWLTYDAYQWAAHFAEVSTRTGLEVPAIITAVVAPISWLQGWIFKLYNDSVKE